MPSSSHPSIAAMQSEVRRLLPSLSRAQANVLGELVFAMLMVDGCGMTRICSYVSELLDQAMNTLRQKYREISYEKEAKAGVKQGRCKRRELVVEELFADLLRGVLKDWQGPKTLVLALDASTLSDRLTVLSISVLYRGCGIRVVSDIPLSQAKTGWSQLRFWIEDEYKDGKRGWFHWEHSKMTKPERASRLWLVLAIAMQKAVLLGGALEAQEQEAQRKKRRDSGKKRRRGRPLVSLQRPRGREQSVLMRGVMAMGAKETGGQKGLPEGRVRSQRA